MAMRSHVPDVDIPDNVSLSQFILDKTRAWPDRKALIYGDTGKSITYGELRVMCARLANGLMGRGFKAGDVMCIIAPTIPEYLITMLSVPMFGGVVTGINPLWTVDEMATQIADAKVKYVMVVPQLIPKVNEVMKKVSCIKEVFTIGKANGHVSFEDIIQEGHSTLPFINMNPKTTLAYLHYSSGTTGMPKGVMSSHHNILTACCILGKEGNPLFVKDHEVTYVLFPMFHVGGSGTSLLAILSGVTCIFYPSFDFEIFLQAIQKYKVTTQIVPPPVLVRLAKDPLVDRYDLSSINAILTGAAPLSKETTQEVRNRLGIKYILQLYGMTEGSGMSHQTFRDDMVDGSAGKIVPNVEVKIIDLKTGKPLGPNEAGEICGRGPHIMLGYLNKDYVTKETIDDQGWLHSGDIGYHNEAGHLFVVDRLKELIKYKGFQVAPAELEAAILTHPAIADAAVIGIPDERAGDLPRAYVVLKQGHRLAPQDIVSFIDERVAPYKRLRGGVKLVEEIPKSQSGKILRRVLKDQLKQESKSKL